jgi:copper chaperone
MLNFEIPAISCGHCVRAVTDAVNEADPQARVQVDLATHRVSVETVAPRERIVERLVEAGYPPVELGPQAR